MENQLPLDLFTAFRIDKRACEQLEFCSEKMKANNDSRTAAFYRQAFARAVFSYFIAARNLLWLDTRASDLKAKEPLFEEHAVFTSLLAVFRQHNEVHGKAMEEVLSEDEEQLLQETEGRLVKLVFPSTSYDLIVSAEDTDRITKAMWVLNRVMRS